MYVSLSRLRVDPEKASWLITAFKSRAHLVDDAEGFIDLEVWQSDRDPDEIIMVSRWRDRASFSTYMKSDAHAASHGRIPDELQSGIALERLEHLHTYHVVAT